MAAGVLGLTGGTAGAVGGYRVTAPPGVNIRSGPGTGYGIVGHLAQGAALDISCQTHSGSFVNGSDVWDQIGPGFVTDYYVSTPVVGAYTPGIPVCGGGPSPAAAPPRTRMVVMGDSYSSGEGTYNANNDPAPAVDYYPETASTNDHCHRSSAAYAPLLGVAGADFVACSGATVPNVLNGKYSEGSQLRVLDAGVRTVIISIGGDDVGFGDVIGNCVDVPAKNPKSQDDCTRAIGVALGKIPGTLQALHGLYGQIMDKTHGAQLIVVGYPRIFPPGGAFGCNWIDEPRQLKLNEAADALDEAIKGEVGRTPGATFVDVRPVFAGHEICGNTSSSYFNDLQVNVAIGPVQVKRNCPDDRIVNGACSQSFHPTVAAYKAEADLLRPLIEVRSPAPAPPVVPPAPPRPPVPAGLTGPSYRYRVQGTCGAGGCILLTRTGPGSGNTSPGRLHEGDPVDIVCQDQGQAVTHPGGRTSDVWDRLTDGTWVSDLYVNTPNVNAFSPPIPQCPSYDRTSVGGGPRRY